VSAGEEARWGFHQLTESWAGRLVQASLVHPGDLVLDVGAGTGALTGPLVAAGARVIAIELHPGRARMLSARFGSRIIVVRADAADLKLPRRPFRVVANPPFASVTGLLRRLVSPGSRLLSADLVLPRFVAARWVDGRAPGAQRWSFIYHAQVVRRLPATAFLPPATGPTAVVRLVRRQAGSAVPNAPPPPPRVIPCRLRRGWRTDEVAAGDPRG
jgi:23S rRNA (adenine-N6)-dimethyltransferase